MRLARWHSRAILRCVDPEVVISPVDLAPDDGSLIDPDRGRFVASLQGPDRVIEEIEVEGADAAILWGRARAEIVIIRLGARGDCVFSAGDVVAYDEDDPLPLWPPDPPAAGWWVPQS
jgi:hypothetical protein